jgi:polar amino acid transport system substrate-binding protein
MALMTTLKHLALVFFTIVALFIPGHLLAQSQSGTQIISDEPLVFGTVHRPPFAYTDGDQITGFSIELMRAIADELGRDIVFEPNDRFSGMLINVRSGNVDGAIANISITAERERTMDFSQPIFGGGASVLVAQPRRCDCSDCWHCRFVCGGSVDVGFRTQASALF